MSSVRALHPMRPQPRMPGKQAKLRMRLNQRGAYYTGTAIMDHQEKLIGRQMLINSAGTRFGREIALEFARQDADAALHCVYGEPGAESAAEEIFPLGRRAAVAQANRRAVR